MIKLSMRGLFTTWREKKSIALLSRRKVIFVLLFLGMVTSACGGIIIDVPNRAAVTPESTLTATHGKGLTPITKPRSTQVATISPSTSEPPVDTPAPTISPAPTSTPVPSLSPTPTIPAITSPGWEGVTLSTLCLAVWDHYPQSVGAYSLTDEITAATVGLLSRLGIQTVPQGEPCEAELTILLSFRAVGTRYSGGSVLYTGARTNGQLTLSAPERELLVVPVNSMVLLQVDSDSSGRQPASPSDAPYESVWREPVLAGLAQIWGDDVLRVGLGGDGWEAEASNLLRASENTLTPTQLPPSSGTNTTGSSLVVQHDPNPAVFIPAGVSGHEFTCYFQSTIQAHDTGVHIKTFGMDYYVDGKWVRDLKKLTGPWTADEFADWYDCPGAFIPAGEACTDPNNWLGSDYDKPFMGLWYYRGVDERGNPVTGEAQIECGPE